MRRVSVFFDLEDQSHKPSLGESKMEENVDGILTILNKYGVKAAFCTCGVLAQNYPSLIKRIHASGNEMASHGYRHENFLQLSQEELDRVLSVAEELILSVTGERPSGIRSPWLLANKRVYEVIERRGYKWISNKYAEFPEARNRPDRAPPASSQPRRLNIGLLRRSPDPESWWTSYPKEPYRINQMFEIPMLSSMDGDLLFYMPPVQKSPEKWLDYAYQSWVSQFNRSENYFNLNFHPWVIASANRISLLDRILEFVSSQDVEFVLPKNHVAAIVSKPQQEAKGG
jgi:peptidoglycan/xylan/chitin deacetylase (PgdA/CDA1 family)